MTLFPNFFPRSLGKYLGGHSVSKYGKTISSVQYFCRSAELYLCVFARETLIYAFLDIYRLHGSILVVSEARWYAQAVYLTWLLC